MRPDTAVFHAHVNGSAFCSGNDNGMWGIHHYDSEYSTWPLIIIWVSAALKVGSPDRHYFQFNFLNYPADAPTACPWDINNQKRLDSALWPKGTKFVSNTFNPGWNANALYAPCDRLAMPGHEAWQSQFPDLWWQPSFTVVKYLEFLHRLLNSSDYVKT